ncbi:MAG: zinc ribbon domain-containing protein [Candidatus Hydrogenedentes bacterium]|nr:zinc ribbon domain-containing protein [Candidatus Hydrogenedentota bacterium]
MPTYTYQCQVCHVPTDVFHAMSAKPRVKCSSCGSGKMQKLIGTGAGIIFKGSGFYETDYKSKTGGEGKDKGDSGAKAEGKSEGSSESKSETKSESKSESKAAKPTEKSKAKKKD